MSVLTRHPTVPAQRTPEREAPIRRPAPRPSATKKQRSLLLIAGGAVVVAAGVGTTAYVLYDDGSPAAPSTRIDVPFESEAKRDAAAAARNDAGSTAITEAKRDAAAAARHDSSTP